MKEILNNPVVKMWLNKNFRNYLAANNLKGVFLTLNEKQEITLIDIKKQTDDNRTTTN